MWGLVYNHRLVGTNVSWMNPVLYAMKKTGIFANWNWKWKPQFHSKWNLQKVDKRIYRCGLRSIDSNVSTFHTTWEFNEGGLKIPPTWAIVRLNRSGLYERSAVALCLCPIQHTLIVADVENMLNAEMIVGKKATAKPLLFRGVG